jgi:ribosomal protein L16/L10AE
MWVKVFTNIPITSKPIKARMGKRKGNYTSWIARGRGSNLI